MSGLSLTGYGGKRVKQWRLKKDMKTRRQDKSLSPHSRKLLIQLGFWRAGRGLCVPQIRIFSILSMFFSALLPNLASKRLMRE